MECGFFFSIISRDMIGVMPGEKSLQITPGQANNPDEALKLIERYQEVRRIADGVQDNISIFYGAMGSCILPILYALLGACAYLLRSTEKQFKLRTLNIHDRTGCEF
jgi:hypothetical protein